MYVHSRPETKNETMGVCYSLKGIKFGKLSGWPAAGETEGRL